MAKFSALARMITSAAATLAVTASVLAATVHVAARPAAPARHLAVCAFCWDERR
jgi:hypothetical protein